MKKKYGGFTRVTVLGLIIVAIYVALEFTGVINFIDYRPQNTIETTLKNYPGDAVFLNYCLDNNIIKGEEALKCIKVVGKRADELSGEASLVSPAFELTKEQLEKKIEEQKKRLQELDILISYLKRASVG